METEESSKRVSTSDGAIVSGVLRTLKNVEELLNCSACSDFMYGQIYQCHNGHTMCLSCKLRVQNKCPTCRQPVGDIRCLTLEKIAESVELGCKYEEYGCLEIIPYCRKLKHEESCKFRPYKCPRSPWGCPEAVGDISSLVSHLTDHHRAKLIDDCNFIREFNIENLREDERCTWMVNVSHCFGQYFSLFAEASHVISAYHVGCIPVYVAFVYFMGKEKDACNYRYRLEIEGNGGKFVFEDIPRSLREDRLRIMERGDALILMRRSLTRCLDIAVRIWKT